MFFTHFSCPAVHHYEHHEADHQLAHLVFELHALKLFSADPYGVMDNILILIPYSKFLNRLLSCSTIIGLLLKARR